MIFFRSDFCYDAFGKYLLSFMRYVRWILRSSWVFFVFLYLLENRALVGKQEPAVTYKTTLHTLYQVYLRACKLSQNCLSGGRSTQMYYLGTSSNTTV